MQRNDRHHKGMRRYMTYRDIEDCRLKIEYLRSASGGSIFNNDFQTGLTTQYPGVAGEPPIVILDHQPIM